MPTQTIAWNLTQDRVDMVAQSLHKLEVLLDIAAPGFLAAENVAKLLTDLRAQCCKAGGDDPCPYRPFSPRFADTIVPLTPPGIWPEESPEVSC